MTSLSLSLKLSAIKTLSAVQRAINILKSAGPGAWYDPSDLTTLFQDSAGTTPVTAVEQPVGLILDKSQGLVLGAELVSSLDFATWGSSEVILKSGNSFTTSGWGGCWLAVPGWSSSKSYRINLTGACTSSWYLRNADFGLDAGSVSVPAGAFSLDVTVTSMLQNSNGNLYIQTVDAGVFTATLFSLKELPGNHLIQPTATSRPTLSSRYNLFTESEFRNGLTDAPTRGGLLTATTLTGYAGALAFGHDGSATTYAYKSNFTAVVGITYDISVIVEMTDGLAPVFVGAADGATVPFALVLDNIAVNPAVYSVSLVSGNMYRVSGRAAATTGDTSFGVVKYNTNNNRTFKIAAYELKVASDASLPYQRVNTATDYDFDFSKFPPFLRFDGVDDGMYSAASIDFTSTDKMTVFAGVHKASDAATAALVELSANALTTNGAFVLGAPFGTGTATYDQYVRGTVVSGVALGSTPAPATNVITAVGDIAGDLNRVTKNGTTSNQIGADQGTGNFGNYPLYIGRRNNDSFPFNGRLYQLALKGKAMTAAEISTVEAFFNSRTKAF